MKNGDTVQLKKEIRTAIEQIPLTIKDVIVRDSQKFLKFNGLCDTEFNAESFELINAKEVQEMWTKDNKEKDERQNDVDNNCNTDHNNSLENCETLKINEEEIIHLTWIYNRMWNVHGENKNVDYMLKFAEILNIKEEYNNPCGQLGCNQYNIPNNDEHCKKCEYVEETQKDQHVEDDMSKTLSITDGDKTYEFEKPTDFKVELLKAYSKHIIGQVVTHKGRIYPCAWSFNGKQYDSSPIDIFCQNMFPLKPIKEYQQRIYTKQNVEGFKPTQKFKISWTKDMSRTLEDGGWILATNEEIEALKIKDNKCQN
jgi:hypothetical protein